VGWAGYTMSVWVGFQQIDPCPILPPTLVKTFYAAVSHCLICSLRIHYILFMWSFMDVRVHGPYPVTDRRRDAGPYL